MHPPILLILTAVPIAAAARRAVRRRVHEAWVNGYANGRIDGATV